MKFISEMTPEEQVPHVFGHDYKRDAKGNPISQGLGSEWSLANGKSDHVLQGHITGIARDEGLEAAHLAMAKIQADRRANGFPEFQFEKASIERAARAGEAARAIK